MKITIVGGGNIGTLMAAEFASKGNKVTVFTSSPGRFENIITVLDNNGKELFFGEIELATDDICVAADAEYIFVTLPSIAQESFAKKLLPYVKKRTKIGIVPGYGGAEFLMSDTVSAGAELFGFQRVHAIARLDKYGKSVVMKGRKDSLFLGALNNEIVRDLCADMEDLFDMPCIALPNYLCVTLTPSNPILHTPRL
jgi:ketopantoate reductase